MSSWAEQRRADRVAAREQDRLDTIASAELRSRERAEVVQEARDDRAERDAARRKRRAEAKARRANLRAWVSAHVVEVLIYPLAVVSAVMAMPAMAAYGLDVYDNPTGVVLFVLSELGMWAFAAAVTVSRRRHPDRPTAMLTAGVAVFAAVGFGLNFAHGYSDGIVVALVMGVVSVSGVVAHQLVTAVPRRSRADRTRRRLDRLADRKLARARRLATRSAVVELAADGSASLVYVPGLYEPRRSRLVAAASLPSQGPPAGSLDDWDALLVDLLDGRWDDGHGGPVVDPTTDPDLPGSGGVALAETSTERPSRRRPIDPQARRKRTPAQELAAARKFAEARRPLKVNAAQLRKELGVSQETARRLRDTVNAELYGDRS